MPALHQGFLRYRNFFFLKAALLLCLGGIIGYAWHDPAEGPSGSTWLGYTLGTIGALLIFWLAWLGVRKRRYAGGAISLKAWLSGHVYLGLSLIIVATLHTGFRFGWNIHSVAYALMLLVIASGIYGVVAYARYPGLITRNHADANLEAWLSEIQDLNEQALKLADNLGDEVHQRVVRSNERVRLGGSAWQQLRGRARRRAAEAVESLSENLAQRMLAAKNKAQALSQTGQFQNTAQFMNTGQFQRGSMSTVMFMADQLVSGIDAGTSESERIAKLLDVIARRQELVARANRDIAMTARMHVWLYLHVPLTFALLAALVAHIVSVFLYW